VALAGCGVDVLPSGARNSGNVDLVGHLLQLAFVLPISSAILACCPGGVLASDVLKWTDQRENSMARPLAWAPPRCKSKRGSTSSLALRVFHHEALPRAAVALIATRMSPFIGAENVTVTC
jgi:hypothetical protein